MVKLQEIISLCAVFIALIKSSKCGSFVTVTEGEAVQLEFPYPCDSSKVTIQSSNRAPFYSSTDSANLHLPNYQVKRFSVTNGNCSVQVDINPVKRIDEATYICQTYRDGVIHSIFTMIRLNVNYPPGNVSCTLRINDDAVGDWVSLQCTAPIGSLAGEIYCYRDSERLPPQSKLVQNGDTMKQAIWIRKEYSVFCCSSILDQPKDRCDCKDFVWNPVGNILQTKTKIDPCPATTPHPVVTLPQYPEREVEDNPLKLAQLPQPTESLNLTDKGLAVILKGAVAFVILVIILGSIILYQVDKVNTCSLKKTPAEDKVTEGTYLKIIEKQECASQTYQKEPGLHTLSSNDKQKSKSWGVYWKEVILTTNDSTKSKSTSEMPLHEVL